MASCIIYMYVNVKFETGLQSADNNKFFFFLNLVFCQFIQANNTKIIHIIIK